MRYIAHAFAALWCLSLAGYALGRESPADDNVFVFDEFGFAITKPAGWHLWRRSDWEYSAEVVYGSAPAPGEEMPLIIISKQPEPMRDLNASIAVYVSPGMDGFGIDPVEMLELLVSNPPYNHVGQEVVQAPVVKFLSGVPAAATRIRYGLRLADGEIIPAVEEIWQVNANGYTFTITVGAKQDGSTGMLEEVLAILDSAVFDRPSR